jgi:hypothetical protein
MYYSVECIKHIHRFLLNYLETFHLLFFICGSEGQQNDCRKKLGEKPYLKLQYILAEIYFMWILKVHFLHRIVLLSQIQLDTVLCKTIRNANLIYMKIIFINLISVSLFVCPEFVSIAQGLE